MENEKIIVLDFGGQYGSLTLFNEPLSYTLP